MSEINYFDAVTASAFSDQPTMDRARGGKMKVTLQIPSKTYQVQGGKGGQITTDKMSVTFELDLEQMPLVNVAGYRTDRAQIEPDSMPYPNGVTVYDKTFG